MSFERISFPNGLTPSQSAKLLLRSVGRGVDDALKEMLQAADVAELSEGNYDLTPPQLATRRYRYNLVIMGRNAAIMTKTLNPDRRHTPLDRVRDFLHFLSRRNSTVVKIYRMPPKEVLTVPPFWDRVTDNLLFVDMSQRVYTHVYHSPDDDDSNKQVPVPTPRDIVGVS